MKTIHQQRWLFAATIIGVLALPLSTAFGQGKGGGGGGGGAAYSLVVLSPPNVEVNASYAHDLNELGEVVGCYEDPSDECRGFYYNLAQDTFLLFDRGVRPHGINNLGEMVGFDWNTGPGFYWRSPDDQTPVSLSPLMAHQTTAAYKINDDGIIIGASQGPGFPVAVAWKVNGDGTVSAPILLPFPDGDIRGSVVDLSEVDNDGVCRIVSFSGAIDLYETAVQWEVAVDLGGALSLFSGPTDVGPQSSGYSAAFGVNSAGDIVGQSRSWPFYKPAGQPAQPLVGIRKATWGYAEGINDAGTMVGQMGYLSRGASIEKAMLWSDATTVIDLNKQVSLGSSDVLESAFRISDSGAILASGFFPNVTEQGNVGCLLVPNQ